MRKIILGMAAGLASLMMISCASTGAAKEKKVKLDFSASLKANFSKVDLDEDLAALRFLITDAYAGYDVALENDFDIDASIAEIKEETLKNLTSLGMIDTKFYQNKIFEVLNRDMKITDMHFSVGGFGYSRSPVSKKVVFTNLYFERNGDEYFLLHTDDDRIPEGGKYTGPERNLYETFYGDRVLYRYGAYVVPSTTRLSVSLNGQQYPVSVIKTEELKNKNSRINTIETDECIYFSLNTFSIGVIGTDYYQFEEACKKLATENPEKTVILDLRNNGGGDMTMAIQLMASVYFPYGTQEHIDFYDYGLRECFKFKIEKDSDAFRQRKEFQKKEFEAYGKILEESKYNREPTQIFENADVIEFYEKDSLQKRQVIILINEGVASASEYCTAMAYLAKNADVTLIGNRSVGAVDYVSIRYYNLPKSGLNLSLGNYHGAPPCISQHENFHRESEGFWPDWWTPNENMLNTLIQLTGDKSLEEKLAGLEKYKL